MLCNTPPPPPHRTGFLAPSPPSVFRVKFAYLHSLYFFIHLYLHLYTYICNCICILKHGICTCICPTPHQLSSSSSSWNPVDPVFAQTCIQSQDSAVPWSKAFALYNSFLLAMECSVAEPAVQWSALGSATCNSIITGSFNCSICLTVFNNAEWPN